jgi:hypothetical protein
LRLIYGAITAGRVIFGPDNVEPVLGATALEPVGITVDPANQTLRRLPAISLKKRFGQIFQQSSPVRLLITPSTPRFVSGK